MQNSTSLSSDLMQTSIYYSKAAEIGRVVLVFPIVLCFCFFLYLIVVMLHFYFTSPRVKEHARYVLFAHMLINDTMYLSVALFFLLAAMFVLPIPMAICYILVTLAASSFKITPYNLAFMALERYIAICFPLRHVTLCTPQRSNAAIALMWVIGLIPSLADFVALCKSVDKNFFTLSVICTRESLTINDLQKSIRSFSLIISLTLVALIILFTYVKVMLVARQISSGGSALKAAKTVMLHAFQLLLCIMSLSSSFTEPYFRDYIFLFIMGNFIICMCLPRFLSPLIYGMRDEIFKQCIGKMFPKSLKQPCCKLRSNKLDAHDS
ncbi:odorant receptor 131-2-like [Pelobates fuscus]|uniref:odorant receptor 131-2-like n=1 Tax=Pelobates fuscus TaxID=191477 RepID=UPI002FE43657